MYKTIAQQAAEIPRPKIKGIEVAPGKIELHIAERAVKAVTEPPEAPQETEDLTYHEPNTVLGRFALNMRTVMYDKFHGTDFWGTLVQKREDERNLRFATEIGLISLQDVSCRKHEHAVAEMRGLR